MTTPQPDRQCAGTVEPGFEVTIRRGSIYLSRELCDAHLAGASAIALVVRDGRTLIVPLIQQSAGGMLLKIRNARGDRVLHAQEFLRGLGVPEDFMERRSAVRWLSELSALAMTVGPVL